MTGAVGYKRLLLSLSISFAICVASYKLPFTSSWAGGASLPQYTAAYQPDAAFTRKPSSSSLYPPPNPRAFLPM